MLSFTPRPFPKHLCVGAWAHGDTAYKATPVFSLFNFCGGETWCRARRLFEDWGTVAQPSYNTIQYNTIQYNCMSPFGNYRNSCSPLTIQPHIVNDAHTVFGRGSHAALYYKYKLWVPHMTTKSRRKDINNHKIRLSTQQTSTIDFNIYTQTKMHCEINIIVERQVRLISINTHKQKCTVW